MQILLQHGAAIDSGVSPFLFAACTSAPASSRTSTQSFLPYMAAHMSAVSPRLFVASSFAPAPTSARTTPAQT